MTMFSDFPRYISNLQIVIELQKLDIFKNKFYTVANKFI